MDGIGNISTQPGSQSQLAGAAAANKGSDSDNKLPETQRVLEAPRSEKQANQKDPEQARFEAVKEAALKQIANTFAVSDSRFTIYKQLQGTDLVYVTRFTSLRDGSVTVIPEQDLLRDFSTGGSLLSAEV